MHRTSLLLLMTLVAFGCSESETPDAMKAPVPDSAGAPDTTAAADARPVILAFGDSLTAGSGLPLGSGYPEQLQRELDSRGYAYRVINAGIGGDTTGGGLARLQSALSLHPAIVILELGANDGLRGLPTGSTAANLDEMIAAFQGAGARVILAGMTLPRNLGADYISDFEKIFTGLAAKRGITLIPFFLEGVAGQPGFVLEDGMHPNERGYQVVTEIVLKYLEPMLKKG